MILRKENSFHTFLIFVIALFFLPVASLRADEVATRKTYVLVVGINNYPQPYGKLSYAAEDAEKIASLMKENGIADYKKEKDDWVFIDRPEVVFLSDKTNHSEVYPTRENILRELNAILSKVNENDFVMLFFSGHGTGESLVTTTMDGRIETIELKEILTRLDSKTQEYMLFIDACRNTNSETKKFSATLEPGDGGFKSIFYSTGKDSVSQENSKLGHGVYTYYLLEALKGAADVNRDFIISSDEIRNYVSDKVNEFTDNQQKPQLHQISSATKFISQVTKPTPWKYVWRSALVPGMGQWEKGHKINSIFFFSSAFIGGLYLYSKNLNYESEKNEYYSRQTLLLLSSPMVLDNTDLILFQATQSIRKDLIGEARSLETAVDFLFLFYLWNLWDAGFTRNEWIDSNKPKLKLDSGNYVNPIGGQERMFRLTTEWRF
jgi:hypothetical protein